jgi:hypothetical protein
MVFYFWRIIMSVFQSIFVELSTITASRYSGVSAALAALQVDTADLPQGLTPLLRQEVIPSNEITYFATRRRQLEGELSLIATRHSQLGWLIDPQKVEVARKLISAAKVEYEDAKSTFLLKYPAMCDSVLQEFHEKLDGHPASAQIIRAVKEMQPTMDYVQRGIGFSTYEIAFESVGEQATAIIEGLRGRAIADITRWSSEGLSAKSPAASYKKVCAIQSKLESLGYYISAFGDLAAKFKPIFEQMSKDPSTSYADAKLTESDRFEMRKQSAYLKSFNSGNDLHSFVEGYSDQLTYSEPDIVVQASLLVEEAVPVISAPQQSNFASW